MFIVHIFVPTCSLSVCASVTVGGHMKKEIAAV